MQEKRTLTPEAQADRDDFEAYRAYHGGCTCFISAPCGFCTHPGNPINQEEDESVWIVETAQDSKRTFR